MSLPDGYMTRNFTYEELKCKCGCGLAQFATGFLEELQALRDQMNVPMRVNSACRCSAHNSRVGGHPRSLHVGDFPIHPTGGTCAVDIGFAVGHPHRNMLMEAAWSRGWSVGVNNRFIHLDRRSAYTSLQQARFTY